VEDRAAGGEEGGRRTVFGGWRELGRFALSGTAGSVIFFGIYELVYAQHFVAQYNAPFSWALSYLLASFVSHGIHRRHTFHWSTPYWGTLGRTVLVYVVSLTATTGLDFALVEQGLHHRMAWLVTLLAGGLANYFALRHWGFRPGNGPRAAGRGRP
jgi:putative flippase GtrA